MKLIKLIGCFVAFIVLVAVVAPVSANTYIGSSQVGSKFYGKQIYAPSALKLITTGTNNNSYLKYNFAVKGSGTTSAFGQVSTYASYHSQTPSQTLTSSESTSVSGTIYSFSKIFSFSS